MPGKIFPHIRPWKPTTTFKENDLFRGVFAWSDKNACVGNNGGPYDLFDYSEGYFKATRVLLEIALKAPDLERPWLHIDTMVYPICLNFRHALELYLKYLITGLANKTGSWKSYKPNHSLADNWVTAQKLIKSAGLETTEDEIKLMDTIVRSIEEVDPKGEIFRYPESIKGDQHLKDWSLINLRVLDKYRNDLHEVAYRWHDKLERLPKS